MAEGLKSYIERRRQEGQPLYFSNMVPDERPGSWPEESKSVYFRPEQTWTKETETELRNPASGFDYSEDIGRRFPTTPKTNEPPSRGSILNTALAELQQHIPGIVQHTLGGKAAPSTDEEKRAVQQNIKSYFNMLLKDVEKSAVSPSKKEKEFEYYKGLSRSDKAAFEKIYGKKGKGTGEKATFAEKEQYKYLVGQLQALDKKLTGEFSEDLTNEERGKIQSERQTILEGMMALEDKMGGKRGMERASSGSTPSGNVSKREAIQQAVDAGASKADILNYVKENPKASVNDFLNHFGVSSKAVTFPGPELVPSHRPTGNAEPVEKRIPGAEKLTPRSEEEFQNWYKHYSDTLGLNQDPDAPEHYYDYRSAFLQGAEPNEEGHWPSEFKLEGHPRMVVDGINTKTGEPVETPDIKNTPVNKTQPESEGGGLKRKSVPYKENPLAAPTEEQKEAAKQELIDLASKLGLGPQDWKAALENYKVIGQMAKDVGGWAWDSYTRAIGTLLSGQEESRKKLPAYRGQ